MISLVLAAALFAAAEPAAATAPAATPAAAAKAKPAKNDMVCRKEVVAGSRMKQRVCMTQGEWDQRQLEDRQMLDKAQSLKPLAGD